MANREQEEFCAITQIYNENIDKASELLTRKLGVFNQEAYLDHIESVAPERIAFLEGAKRRHSVSLAEFDLVPIPSEQEERFFYSRQREALVNKLKSIEENLEGFEKLPAEVQERREALGRELEEINAELEVVQGILMSLGTKLDKNLLKRQKSGKKFCYKSVESREAMAATAINKLANQFFNNDIRSLMRALEKQCPNVTV